MVMNIAQQYVRFRNACGLRDSAAEYLVPLNFDHVSHDECHADTRGFEYQGSDVQTVVPMNAVGRLPAQIVPAHEYRSGRSDVDFRVSCTQFLSATLDGSEQ